MKIIRSYARKISHEYYGGNKFEITDLFASYEQEVAEALGDDKFKSISDDLFAKAKADVEEQVKATIESMSKVAEEKNRQF